LPSGEWLQNLRGLLQPLHPVSLALLGQVPLQRDPSWTPRLPAETVADLATDGFDPAHASGWLIRLGTPDGPPQVLHLGTKQREAAEPAVILGIALCRLAWRLHCASAWRPSSPEPQLRDAVHTLRNAMNSMLMNASVLGTVPLPDALQPIRVELGNAAERSLKSLHELMVLVGSE
jgi:hypothetical protein